MEWLKTEKNGKSDEKKVEQLSGGIEKPRKCQSKRDLAKITKKIQEENLLIRRKGIQDLILDLLDKNINGHKIQSAAILTLQAASESFFVEKTQALNLNFFCKNAKNL